MFINSSVQQKHLFERIIFNAFNSKDKSTDMISKDFFALAINETFNIHNPQFILSSK